MPELIRIVCDAPNPRHPKRRPQVQVTTFRPVGGGWTEHITSPYVRRQVQTDGGLDSGVSLVGDEVYRADVHGGMEAMDELRGKIRSNYTLDCSHCSKSHHWKRPYQYSQGKLFAALNHAQRAGRRCLTLAELDAIVRAMAHYDA